jgi:hypothetical protein
MGVRFSILALCLCFGISPWKWGIALALGIFFMLEKRHATKFLWAAQPQLKELSDKPMPYMVVVSGQFCRHVLGMLWWAGMTEIPCLMLAATFFSYYGNMTNAVILTLLSFWAYGNLRSLEDDLEHLKLYLAENLVEVEEKPDGLRETV